MTVTFSLTDFSGGQSVTVLERRIGRRVDLSGASPAALVRGYGVALDQILQELNTELAAIASEGRLAQP